MFHIPVFVLSLVAALGEAALSVFLFSSLDLPIIAVIGIVFASAMLLSFIVIFIVGYVCRGLNAADFVKTYFGRTLILAVCSVALIGALACGAEAIYQIQPREARSLPSGSSDVCFILDASGSMYAYMDNKQTRLENTLTAFDSVINKLDDGKRIAILLYDDTVRWLYDGWQIVSPELKARIRKDAAQVAYAMGGTTDITRALSEAENLLDEALGNKQAVAVVMLSDGESDYTSVQVNNPFYLASNIPVHSIYLGQSDSSTRSVLQTIANQTGGTYMVASDDMQLNLGFDNLTTIAVGQTSQTDSLLFARVRSDAYLFSAPVLRVALLTLLGFVFKLIIVVCLGRNKSSMRGHVLHAVLLAVLGAAAVELGFAFGLSGIIVLCAYWLILMTQFAITD